MATPTQRRTKKRKEERKRKAIISKKVTEKQRKGGTRQLSRQDRADLRRKELRKGGEFAKDVEGKEREKDVKEVAKRSFEIGAEKERLGKAKKETEKLRQEEIKEKVAGAGETRLTIEEQGFIPADSLSTFERGNLPGNAFVDIDGKKFVIPKDQRQGLSLFGTAVAGGVTGGAVAGALTFEAFLTGAGPVSVRAINKIATTFKLSTPHVTKLIERQLLRESIVGATKTVTAVQLAKIGFAGAVTLATTDVIFQWYALDNVIGGQKFYIKDVLSALKSEAITTEQANEAIAESREIRQTAIDKVILSNSINPVLWAFRKLILAGVKGDQLAIELIEDQIETLGGIEE